MRVEKSFGEEMSRAQRYGQGIYINPVCDICGKYKAGKSHPKCSRIRQQRARNEKAMSTV